MRGTCNFCTIVVLYVMYVLLREQYITHLELHGVRGGL